MTIRIYQILLGNTELLYFSKCKASFKITDRENKKKYIRIKYGNLLQGELIENEFNILKQCFLIKHAQLW